MKKKRTTFDQKGADRITANNDTKNVVISPFFSVHVDSGDIWNAEKLSKN